MELGGKVRDDYIYIYRNYRTIYIISNESVSLIAAEFPELDLRKGPLVSELRK